MSDSRVILHLGLGSFHRAHQAVYLQGLHDQGLDNWSIVGGNIRADMDETIELLRRQNCRYTLETVAPDGTRAYQSIESIKSVIPYEKGLTSLSARGAAPETTIISFTVTEAGYYLATDDSLDLTSAELQADIDAARRGDVGGAIGSTIYGALTAILRARKQSGAGQVTLLSCDNLRHNGKRSRAGLLEFVQRINDPALTSWIEQHSTSPNCMVDRITPRPVEEVRQRVLSATGHDDPAALMSESFIQWVIEDNFCAGRPQWEKVGAELVSDVAPYEEAKIRLLNATHSCIAWAGTLAGYQFIHQGVGDADIRQLAYEYATNDVIPSLTPSPLDLPAYRDVVLKRFSNPGIEDSNQRVAADGFAKMPGFIVPTVADCLADGRSIDAVAVLPALFLSFLQRWHKGQLPYEYQDQAMDPAVAHEICNADDPVAEFCADHGLWGPLAGDKRLEAGVRNAAERVGHFLRTRDS
ncbi:MAG: D-arabinitol 4-dehydrogenase [Burkholderiaceae bacterium]